MGGKAFSERLPATVFPRISPAFYNSLKVRIVPCLEALYHLITVPPEAPRKFDHGDPDIVVCQPNSVKEGIPLSECATFIRKYSIAQLAYFLVKHGISQNSYSF